MLPAHFIHSKFINPVKQWKTWLLLLSACFVTSHLHAQAPVNKPGPSVNSTPDTITIWQLSFQADNLRFKAPDSSLSLYQQALEKSSASKYTEGIAYSLLGIASLFTDRGDLSQSLDVLRIARPDCEVLANKNGKYLVWLNKDIAAVYVQKNILDSAAYYYSEAIKQFDRKRSADTSLLLSIYIDLGAMWVEDKQYDLALKYLLEANDLGVKTKNELQLGEVYTNLAAVCTGRQLYDSAIFYGKQAIIFNERYANKYMSAFASFEIGNAYYYKKQPATAIRYYELTLYPENNIPLYLRLNTNLSMGKAYYKLKKYPDAEEYYLNVLNTDQVANFTAILIETYISLDSLYSITRNYKYALKYKELASVLKDSTLNAEKIEATTRMEVKYNTSEKDKELAQNQLLLTTQKALIKEKNIWFDSAVGGICLILALALTIYRGEKRKRKLQLILMGDLMKEQEIEQLKARLDGEEEERVRIAQELHDGIMVQFSSVKMNLSCVLDRAKDPVEKTALDKIILQLDNATRELRKSAHNLMPDMLLEEGLSEAVYYFLSELKQSTGIDIEFQQIGELPVFAPEYELMLYRMIQELSQNAMKHAHAKHILVQLNCTGNILSLTVEDNGVGFKEGYTHGAGIGIKNIQSRVASLRGNMEIRSQPGVGSTIDIEFDTHYLLKKTQ